MHSFLVIFLLFQVTVPQKPVTTQQNIEMILGALGDRKPNKKFAKRSFSREGDIRATVAIGEKAYTFFYTKGSPVDETPRLSVEINTISRSVREKMRSIQDFAINPDDAKILSGSEPANKRRTFFDAKANHGLTYGGENRAYWQEVAEKTLADLAKYFATP